MKIFLTQSMIPISAEVLWRERIIRFETTDAAISEYNGSSVIMNVRITAEGEGRVYGTFRPWNEEPLRARFIADAEKLWASFRESQPKMSA